MTRPTRPSADETRQKILVAAKQVFLEKGFDATFIKEIAKIAKVHTNLIFHHFTNKETLWHTVKSSILQQPLDKAMFDVSSAKAFLKSLLEYRFMLYSQYPDLVRLLQWQHLTEKVSLLIGTDSISPHHWVEVIEGFQKQGQIPPDIDAQQIVLFIIFSIQAPFFQNIWPLDSDQTQRYKHMIFTICCHQFLTAEGSNGA